MQLFEKETGEIIGQTFIHRGQIEYRDPQQYNFIVPEKMYTADHLLFVNIQNLSYGRLKDTGWILNDKNCNPRRGNYLYERTIEYHQEEDPVAITRDLSAIYALDNPGYYNWHVQNLNNNKVIITTSCDSSG